MSEPWNVPLGHLLDLREALAFRIEKKPVASREQLACLRKLLVRLDQEIKHQETELAARNEARRLEAQRLSSAAPPPASREAE